MEVMTQVLKLGFILSLNLGSFALKITIREAELRY